MNITGSCNFCVQNKHDQVDIFTEQERDIFFAAVYAGDVTAQQLSLDVYQKVARKLTEGVYEGFGNSLLTVQWGTPDEVMLRSLRENVYIFSAAKDYQMTKEVGSLLQTKKGLRPFNEFEAEAAKVFDTYNRNFLTAEYNSAIAQARGASDWGTIQQDKDLYPQLQYQTVDDDRVRPAHRVLDNIIRPVNDNFWNTFMPPNGWNCRCTVIQTIGGVNTELGNKTPPTKDEVPDIFRFNPGKTKQIFSPKHPYFDVAAADKDLALQNWGLPLP